MCPRMSIYVKNSDLIFLVWLTDHNLFAYMLYLSSATLHPQDYEKAMKARLVPQSLL